MKKLVKLALVFSLSFVVLFVLATGMRYLAIQVGWVRMLIQQPPNGGAILTDLISAARWALSFWLYGGMLFGMGYAAREKVFAPAAIICLTLLTAAFTIGISLLAESWDNIPPEKRVSQSLGGPGLMLSNTGKPDGTVLVLLQGPDEPEKARVVAVPGKPMVHQAEYAGREANLHPAPFGAPFNDNTPWFLRSLAIDFRLSAENLHQRMNDGFVSFLLYAAALIFLLSSFWFVMKFSSWPLASLVLGCLIFRGVLFLETFFNSPEMREIFSSFFRDRLPVSLVAPLIFCAFGSLAHLYSFLAHLAKRQVKNAD